MPKHAFLMKFYKIVIISITCFLGYIIQQYALTTDSYLPSSRRTAR